MLNRRLELIVVILAGLACAKSFAQSTDLIGDWEIVTEGFAMGGTTSSVAVTFEKQGDAVSAYIYAGPADVRVNGNEFELDLHWATGWDTHHISTFSGTLNAHGELEGEVDHHGAIDFLGNPMRGGSFAGSRAVSVGQHRA